MKYILISFKSRNETYEFNKQLKSYGIYSSIVNTPRSIASSCSLSIKTDYKNFNQISFMLKNFRKQSLIGVFIIEQNGFTQNAQRII